MNNGNIEYSYAVSKDAPSRVTYQLTPINATTTKLNLVHDDFAGETATYTGSVASWPLLLSSLKSLLETGGQSQRGRPARRHDFNADRLKRALTVAVSVRMASPAKARLAKARCRAISSRPPHASATTTGM